MVDEADARAILAALADDATAPACEGPADEAQSGPTEPAADWSSGDLDFTEDYQTIIDSAEQALDDIDAAAAFVDAGGLAALDEAVVAAESQVSGAADKGRRAREAFEAFQAAAVGDHFHRGRDTSLGDAGVGRRR